MTEKRVAIVTGGGSGIGAAVCRRLGKDGLNVVVSFSTSSKGAYDTVEQIQNYGGSAIAVKANIRIEEDVLNLFRVAIDTFGGVDVVVNNAGVGHYNAFSKITVEEFDEIFGVNARGTFFMCREAARHIGDNGRIVTVSTGITQSPMPGSALYIASKMAEEGYSKVLAKELGPRGITVNVVSPGMTDTPFLGKGDGAELLRRLGAKTSSMKRCGRPEDLADAISALVSQDGRWITGQNIHVDGGTVII